MPSNTRNTRQVWDVISGYKTYYKAKETYYRAKETYYKAKETYYKAKENVISGYNEILGVHV